MRAMTPFPHETYELRLRDAPVPPIRSHGSLRFAGYAALFGVRDGGGDVIRRGAFACSLAERREPLPLNWQHHADLRIGWVEQVAEDARGLRVIATIDNPQGRAGLAVSNRQMTGLSFGYRTRAANHTEAGRELINLELLEISLVAQPMQDGARIHLLG